MAVSIELIKRLREQTGAGITDCQKALKDAEGKVDRAVDLLRERGVVKAAKKSGRATGEGTIVAYIHMGGRIGVLVEVNCETDFVAKTDDFRELSRNIALHIAAASPLYVRREEVPHDLLEKEREIYRTQARESGKPDSVIEKIVEGKIEKFYTETCLLEQPYIKDQDQTVQQLITAAIAKLGENISVKRFARFQVGES